MGPVDTIVREEGKITSVTSLINKFNAIQEESNALKQGYRYYFRGEPSNFARMTPKLIRRFANLKGFHNASFIVELQIKLFNGCSDTHRSITMTQMFRAVH